MAAAVEENTAGGVGVAMTTMMMVVMGGVSPLS